MLLFNNNLEEYIAIDQIGISNGGIILTNVQKEVLKICMVCMPPDLNTDPVYMPKNSCLSFEKIDVNRRKLAIQFEKIIDEFDFLLNMFRERPQLCRDFENIQTEINFMDDIISRNLNQIPNYYEKIQNRDTEKFTNGRLKFIINEYSRLVKLMKSSCNEQIDYNNNA